MKCLPVSLGQDGQRQNTIRHPTAAGATPDSRRGQSHPGLLDLPLLQWMGRGARRAGERGARARRMLQAACTRSFGTTRYEVQAIKAQSEAQRAGKPASP
jgi:hypothetical protein